MISYDIRGIFRTRWVWFDRPHDEPGVDEVAFLSYDLVEAPGFRRKNGMTSIIDLTRSQEELWNGMREKFVRKQIRRGESAGISIEKGTLAEFAPLHHSLRIGKGLGRSRLGPPSCVGNILIASQNGKALAGGMFLGDGTYARAYALASVRFSGADGHSREIAGYASRMVLWEAMMQYKREGYRELDLGGIDPGSKSAGERMLAEFKEAFGGVRKPYAFYRKTYSPLLRAVRRVRSLV